MKIQIDTTNKTIKIEESVNIDEFIKTIKKLLPDNLWKEYNLETGVISYWTYPYVIETWPKYPNWPWYNDTIITCGTSSNIELSDYNLHNNGTYCVEINK